MKEINLIGAAVKNLKRDPSSAMKVLYQAHVKEMLTLAYRLTQNKKDAEDVVQESFIQSFHKIDQLKDPERYGYWLKRIVANKSLKVYQKKGKVSPVEWDGVEEIQEDDHWYKSIPLNAINKAIFKLPDGCREIFTLYLLDGFKHREIADLFKISESTSKSQYRYALKLLKEQLKKYRYV